VKVLATIALGAVGLGLVTACGGDGDDGTSTPRAVVGGKPVVTKSGQRVQVFKLLEGSAADTALHKFIFVSGQICNTRDNGFAPRSRFTLELDHKRTVRPDPTLRTGGTPAVLSATSGMATPNGGCIDGWDGFGVNATDRVTAVIFTPDIRRHPGANQVRFALPPRQTPPTTQFPSESGKVGDTKLSGFPDGFPLPTGTQVLTSSTQPYGGAEASVSLPIGLASASRFFRTELPHHGFIAVECGEPAVDGRGVYAQTVGFRAEPLPEEAVPSSEKPSGGVISIVRSAATEGESSMATIKLNQLDPACEGYIDFDPNNEPVVR
jgi:hypothetical protein